MKLLVTLVLFCFAVEFFAQMPAAITIYPPDAIAYDELTLTFDPAEACFTDGSLDGLDSIAIHSGVSFDNGQQWQYIVEFDSLGSNGQTTILYPTGDGRYSITYTPYDFYGFPNGSTVTEICAVFNNGTNWSSDGRDFDPVPNYCMDFLIPISTGSSCLPYGITFNYQFQIDNFKSEYPGCTDIDGFVEISGENIANLNGLDEITSIGDDLRVTINPLLTNLAGLESLISIDGDLIIGNYSGFSNPLLADLNGLENLKEIGGMMRIKYNESLTEIMALANLSSVGKYIYINDNPSLISLEGLESITTIEQAIGIYRNPKLIDLTGLDNLQYVAGDLFVGLNESMTSLEGINNLDSVLYGLDIYWNPMLTDITALENLSSSIDYLWISENELLTNLNGLENLNSVGENLWIHENPNLADITSLNNIDISSLSELSIYENSSLSNCDIDNLCAFIANPSGSINIYDNASGCSNPIEVAANCDVELSCLPYGNYHFTKQDDVDNFQTIYPECTDLEGMVKISGNGIVDLEGLNTINTINGSLNIRDNKLLPNLSGFDNLTKVSGSLMARNNSSLINFEGLDNLIELGGLYIQGDSLLVNLSGLENIDSIQYNVEIGSEFYLGGNPSLESLSGLNNLVYIGGDFQISKNNNLENLNGLGSLDRIGGKLSISYNDQLMSFTGLENLSVVEGDLSIGYSYYGDGGNLMLASLSGLDNLNSINGDLTITDNPLLTNIFSLDNLQEGSISNLFIHGNGSLASCEASGICDYLANPNGYIEIYDNDYGCDNVPQVEYACETVTINETDPVESLKVYPNPFSVSATFEYEAMHPENITLQVFNQFGQQVSIFTGYQTTGTQKIIINTVGLKPGIYTYSLQIGEHQSTGKLVLIK